MERFAHVPLRLRSSVFFWLRPSASVLSSAFASDSASVPDLSGPRPSHKCSVSQLVGQARYSPWFSWYDLFCLNLDFRQSIRASYARMFYV